MKGEGGPKIRSQIEKDHIMSKTFAIMTAASIGLAGLGGMASGQTALKDVTFVTEGIIATGMAYELSEKCPTISARRLRGISYLISLRNYAMEQGFTSAQVKAYTEDKSEEERLKAIAYSRLDALGVRRGNADSYCTVGRAEIARGTATGRLLR